MRLSLIATAVLGTLAATAQAASREKFASLAHAAKDGVIKLDSASYEQLISSKPAEPRDYSVSVLLTALGKRIQCEPCHTFDKPYKEVAQSWKKVHKNQRDDHFFAQLDFDDGQAVFAKLGLQTAPYLQFFGAKSGPHATTLKQDFITYDFNRNGFGSDNLHNWLSSLVPHTFKLYKPFNPIPYIVLPATTIGGLVMLWMLRAFILPLVQSKIIWQSISLVAILIFIGGHMWNRIRNAQYNGRDGNFVAPGFSSQYVLETQMVSLIYGILAFSTAALAVIAPRMSGSVRQRMAIYVWTGVIIFLFSFLIKVFKVKNPSYPFSLFLG